MSDPDIKLLNIKSNQEENPGVVNRILTKEAKAFMDL